MYTIYYIPDFVWSDGTIGKIGCTKHADKRIKEQGYTNYEVLEEHLDVYIASDREIALQKQYNLRVDAKPYWKVRQMPTMEGSIKGGKKAGITNIESGHMKRLNTKLNSDKEHQSKAGKVVGSMIRTCPHCNKTVKGPSYFVFHGDKCKAKSK
jgi:hypothetical protein